MSECDATVGQVAKGTTASFALGPHGASVCGRTEHALPGVEVVGGVWALVVGVFGGVGVVFGVRIVPFAPAVGVFSCVGEGADGVCGAFGGVCGDFVPADGVDVDEIGVFGALGTVFVCVGGCADGVCGAFGGVCGMFGGVALGFVPADGVGVDEIGVFALVCAVFGGVGGVFGGRIVPFAPVVGVFGGVCGAVVLAVGVFESASAAFGAAEGETGAKRSASDGAGGADVDEATEEGAAERRLC